MYVTGNPKTKAELKRRVAAGDTVKVFSPGAFPAPANGKVHVEGPHYPAPHKWYAAVEVENYVVIKVK